MTKGAPRIYEDIEATADYYGPQIYAGGEGRFLNRGRFGTGALLSFYHDLEMHSDSLGDQFIPLTTAQTRNPAASKLFAVGVLPPVANVTGRILDRSTTYSRGETLPVNPTPEDVQQIERTASTVGGGGDCPAVIGEQILARQEGMTSQQRIDDTIAFWAGPGDYEADGTLKPGVRLHFMEKSHCEGTVKAMWRECGITDPKFMATGEVYESGVAKGQWKELYDPSAWRAMAVSQKAWVDGKSPNMPQRGDAVYALTQGTAAGFSRTVLGVQQKHSFVVLETKGNTTKTVDGGVVGAGIFSTIAIWSKGEDGFWYISVGNTTRKIDGWVSFSNIRRDGAPVQGDAGTGNWKQEGANDAQQAQKEKEKTDASGINPEWMGERLLAAQKLQIAEAQAAIEAMKNTPPLRLLVNPRQFSVKGSKIVQDGNWGRNGPIIEHWGNDQDKISASGKVAGFFALDVNNAVGPGLTRGARHFSLAWSNLMSLYLFYKNNGGLYLKDHMSSAPERKNLSLMGSVYIYYDNILYIGSFDSFNITEDDTTPFTVEYSFEFTVRAAFLLDRPDARYDIQYSSQAPRESTMETLPVTSEVEVTPTKAEEDRRQSIDAFGTQAAGEAYDRERAARDFSAAVRGRS